ncbi:MAG: YdcF family protein [Smithella sp.]
MDEIWSVLKVMLDPLFIIYVLLLVSFFIFYKNIKKKSDSLLLLLCLILLYGVSIAPVSNYLCYYLEKDYVHSQSADLKNNMDAIVVLGNGTKEIKSLKETFNSGMGNLRLLHAVAVFHKTGTRYFVCSGKGESEVSEAQAMAKLAEALGVPKEKIKIEPKSKNTSENAREVKNLLGGNKINIGLVTSAFHMKRSEAEFKKYFDHVMPLPAHYLYSSPAKNFVVRYMPQSEELCKTSIAFREIIAQLWYRIK